MEEDDEEEMDNPIDPRLKDIEEQKKKYAQTARGKFGTKPINHNMTLEEAYDALEVKRDAESVNDMIEDTDKKNFEKIKQNIKNREIKYFAFLNKEYNILNKKLVNCCVFCYDRPNVSTLLTLGI